MTESVAAAMIRRFREAQPSSRTEREAAKLSGRVREMWWVDDENPALSRSGTSLNRRQTEDYEQPRPSPQKPMRQSIPKPPARPVTVHDSIDDLILGDIRELNNESEWQKRRRDLFDSHDSDLDVIGDRSYRYRGDRNDNKSVAKELQNSLETLGSIGFRGLSAPDLKLDGQKDVKPAPVKSEAEDMNNVVSGLEDLLKTLGEANAKNNLTKEGLPSTIMQVYNDVNTHLLNFRSKFDEKYLAEEKAEKERIERDKRMKEEGRKEEREKLLIELSMQQEMEYYALHGRQFGDQRDPMNAVADVSVALDEMAGEEETEEELRVFSGGPLRGSRDDLSAQITSLRSALHDRVKHLNALHAEVMAAPDASVDRSDDAAAGAASKDTSSADPKPEAASAPGHEEKPSAPRRVTHGYPESKDADKEAAKPDGTLLRFTREPWRVELDSNQLTPLGRALYRHDHNRRIHAGEGPRRSLSRDRKSGGSAKKERDPVQDQVDGMLMSYGGIDFNVPGEAITRASRHIRKDLNSTIDGLNICLPEPVPPPAPEPIPVVVPPLDSTLHAATPPQARNSLPILKPDNPAVINISSKAKADLSDTAGSVSRATAVHAAATAFVSELIPAAASAARSSSPFQKTDSRDKGNTRAAAAVAEKRTAGAPQQASASHSAATKLVSEVIPTALSGVVNTKLYAELPPADKLMADIDKALGPVDSSLEKAELSWWKEQASLQGKRRDVDSSRYSPSRERRVQRDDSGYPARDMYPLSQSEQRKERMRSPSPAAVNQIPAPPALFSAPARDGILRSSSSAAPLYVSEPLSSKYPRPVEGLAISSVRGTYLGYDTLGNPGQQRASPVRMNIVDSKHGNPHSNHPNTGHSVLSPNSVSALHSETNRVALSDKEAYLKKMRDYRRTIANAVA
jgi:hypothetical protein